ncbi:MAG TPA: D-alanyl-D-alanine carboxypeptidase/D-alanyl-D-alanine-endopeptidase [Bryobacteraceae bacterium]|nr:D-alanyl-D-alanine carboxypeptidase/D-alanyl-D-alanine-endopeptidase [Bryobacteraceae bacterium]
MLTPRNPSRAVAALVLLLSFHPALFAGTAAKKKKPPVLADQINAILSRPELTRAHWGIDAVDLESGKALYSLNSDQLFMPASNAKLFTTAAALAIAGPEYRFHTSVESAGKIDSHGRLQNDLVLVGRGDPNISGRVMPYQLKTVRIPPHTQVLEEMADQVARSGLKIVDGDLIGDDTFYSPERYGEGWAQDDLQWIDGAPVSALTFNDNVILFNIQPGDHPGDKALITQETEPHYYDFDNRIVTTAAGIVRKIGIHREVGSKKVVLWGSLPLGDSGMKVALAVEDPAEYTAQLFRAMLERRGIVINGKTRARHGDIAQFFDQPPAPPTAPVDNASAGPTAPSAPTAGAAPSPAPGPTPQTAAPTVLAEHVSLPLLEDIRVTNKSSQNLHAELALRLVGKLSGMAPSFEGGSAAVRRFLLQAGLKEDEFVFLDGSGLSRRDLVTPAAVVQLLIYASRQPWGAAYEESLPVSASDGSLAERFLHSPAAGLIHAKTGTLSHVNSLSGYGQTVQGRRFVFSIFCNNHELSSAQTLAAIDELVQLLVTHGDTARRK